MRCKGCDAVFTTPEALAVNITTEEHEDLCAECLYQTGIYQEFIEKEISELLADDPFDDIDEVWDDEEIL